MASGDPSRQRKRLCRFQNYWIDTVDSEYASWLYPDKNNPHKAHCSLCNKTFNIGHGGLNDVKLHCKGKKHFELYCKHRLSLGLEVPQLEQAIKGDFFLDSDTAFGRPDSDSERLAGDCSPQNLLNVEAELSEGGGEIELYNSEDEVAVLDCEVKVGKDERLQAQQVAVEPVALVLEPQQQPLPPPPPPQPKPKAMDSAASQAKMASMTNNADPQQYCLRWKYHHNNLQVMFSQLLERESFCDVTLASEGKLLRAHKVVLSACSTYFDQIFTQYEERNPIVILKDVKYDDIKALVEFMYRGEINIEQSHLASLLKTAEELKVKGLAEVSWRTDEAQAAQVLRQEDDDEPGNKRRRMVSSPAFRPRVTNVMGGIGVKHGAANFLDISMQNEDNGTGLGENFGSDYEVEQPEGMDPEDSMQSNGSYRGGVEMMSGMPPSEKRASPILDERTRELFKGVVKMNDYLVTGRRQQFWEEPFMRRLMDAIKNKEVEMKLVAEMLGVSYGTLYGRYRDTHGCLKHPYRMRDFWNEPGPAEVITKLKNKEVTLNEAADMLNVSMNTLTSYVASMPQAFMSRESLGEPSSATAAVFAAARLPPDITLAATAQKQQQMIKEEHQQHQQQVQVQQVAQLQQALQQQQQHHHQAQLHHHYEQNGGDDGDDDDDMIHPQQLLQVQHQQQ